MSENPLKPRGRLHVAQIDEDWHVLLQQEDCPQIFSSLALCHDKERALRFLRAEQTAMNAVEAMHSGRAAPTPAAMRPAAPLNVTIPVPAQHSTETLEARILADLPARMKLRPIGLSADYIAEWIKHPGGTTAVHQAMLHLARKGFARVYFDSVSRLNRIIPKDHDLAGVPLSGDMALVMRELQSLADGVQVPLSIDKLCENLSLTYTAVCDVLNTLEARGRIRGYGYGTQIEIVRPLEAHELDDITDVTPHTSPSAQNAGTAV